MSGPYEPLHDKVSEAKMRAVVTGKVDAPRLQGAALGSTECSWQKGFT